MPEEVVMIVAYVRSARRASVASTLHDLGIVGWSESAVDGHGTAAAGHGVPHVRFELLLPAHRCDACREAIVQAAHTGQAGGGLVVVQPVIDIQRVGDGRRGPSAVA